MYEDLLPKFWQNKYLPLWFSEDSPSVDLSLLAFENNAPASATLYLKSNQAVLCGLPVFDAIFSELKCIVDWKYDEGEQITLQQGTTRKVIATVHGSPLDILKGERIALNVLSRMSAIASLGKNMSILANPYGIKIAGTRKTTPGFRLFEKYAMAIAGCDTHRNDLTSSLTMLKDNHLKLHENDIGNFIQKVKSCISFTSKLEIEVKNEDEAWIAARNGADILMFDNWKEPQLIHEKAKELKSQFPNLLIEVSGGISQENIHDYLPKDIYEVYIDVLSLGALTQNAPNIDFSLKIN